MIPLAEDDARLAHLKGEHDSLLPVHLYTLTIGTTTHRLTSWRHDLTIGGHRYRASAAVMSSSRHAHKGPVERHQWTLQMAEPPANEASLEKFSIALTGRTKTSNLLSWGNPNGVAAGQVSVYGSSELPGSWFENETEAQVVFFGIRNTGDLALWFQKKTAQLNRGAGPNLKPEVLPRLRIRLTTGSLVYETTGITSDSAEPYEWTPANAAAARQLFTDAGEDLPQTLELAHRPQQWHELAGRNYSTMQLRVELVFMEKETRTITEPLRVYDGIGSGVQTESGKESVTTALLFTGPLARHDAQFTRYTTADSQQAAAAADTSMAKAHETKDSLQWGGV